MREKPRDPARLEHIIKAIDNVFNFVDGKNKEDLEMESMLYFAVVKNIEIIGEAAYMITHDFKKNHPDTPWKQIEGMRHVLVHDYYRISVNEVWGVILNRLIPLRAQVIEYIAELNSNPI